MLAKAIHPHPERWGILALSIKKSFFSLGNLWKKDRKQIINRNFLNTTKGL
jgi:hypothetical protein